MMALSAAVARSITTLAAQVSPRQAIVDWGWIEELQWKCSTCRITSPAVQAQESHMETIMNKLNDMSLKLECLPSLLDDVKGIKSKHGSASIIM